MKKFMYLVICLVLAFSATAMAATEGNPEATNLTANVDANVAVGPYASVMAQRLEYSHFDIQWSWKNFRLEGGHHWDDTVDPLMDFGQYSGKAGQGKFTDSNGFVLETNTALLLTFEGEPLTHTEHPDSKMLTTYWAFTAAGVEPVWPVPNWGLFPAQVIPRDEIGYFGKGDIPRYDGGFSHGSVLDGLMHLLGGVQAWDLWPEQSEVHESLAYTGISTNGIYAFQVFGFAGTDEISSQREGNYLGQIKLTVAKN